MNCFYSDPVFAFFLCPARLLCILTNWNLVLKCTPLSCILFVLQVNGGWILNGRKRWIGNATFADIVIVWARNLDTKEINAFVVRKGTKGFRTTKIENKISLRCVQNANIFLDDCFVRDEDRLSGVNSFKVPYAAHLR